jgi:hypothetical protein
MNRMGWAGAMLAVSLFVLVSIPASAQEYHAKLSGFEEIGSLTAPTGAVLSTGAGTLKLTLDKTTKTITYTLTYSGLTNVLQSHIHFGKEHVAGGIMVFFCSNLANPPAGTPACTDPGTGTATVTGTITAAGVQAIATQNVPAGDFDAVEAALASNTAYANIHTNTFKAGEIRGQIHRVDDDHHGKRGKGDDHDKDKDKGHDH